MKLSKEQELRIKQAIIEDNKEILATYIPQDKGDEEWLESLRHQTTDDIEFRDDLLKQAKKMQKEYIEQSKKNDTINLRIEHTIKEKIKTKASEIGLNYQTFITMLLHQIANNKLVVKTEYI